MLQFSYRFKSSLILICPIACRERTLSCGPRSYYIIIWLFVGRTFSASCLCGFECYQTNGNMRLPPDKLYLKKSTRNQRKNEKKPSCGFCELKAVPARIRSDAGRNHVVFYCLNKNRGSIALPLPWFDVCGCWSLTLKNGLLCAKFFVRFFAELTTLRTSFELPLCCYGSTRYFQGTRLEQ